MHVALFLLFMWETSIFQVAYNLFKSDLSFASFLEKIFIIWYNQPVLWSRLKTTNWIIFDNSYVQIKVYFAP